MKAPIEPWAHHKYIRELVTEHYRHQRRKFVEEMTAFRLNFRTRFKEYEIKVFEARAALLMSSGTKAKSGVALPVFDAPPRPEVKTEIGDEELIMKMALDAITNTKKHNILPPDNFSTR